MKVIDLATIKQVLDIPAAIPLIEQGFAALTSGTAIVPPVGYLGLSESRGDCHIKYGYIDGDDIFVIKIATGFFDNPALGLPVGHGLMLVMSAKTGEILALLDDQGWLTEVRTAIAGTICARYLAPASIDRIGIVGAGFQARMQLEFLSHATQCKRAMVWARRTDQAEDYCLEMSSKGFEVSLCDKLQTLCSGSQLIVTTTPARAPLVMAEWIQPGTHITAMGADADGKQEVEAELFARAEVCVVDSLSQCVDHGETHYAIEAGHIAQKDLVELGAIISGQHTGRSSPDQITIADLTGVAVQDIQIAKAVFSRSCSSPAGGASTPDKQHHSKRVLR